MNETDFLLERFRQHSTLDAVVWDDAVVLYGELLSRIEDWHRRIQGQGIESGTVVALQADFSPDGIAAFLALAGLDCILVPLTTTPAGRREQLLDIAEAEFSIRAGEPGEIEFLPLARRATHEHYAELRNRRHPGLVLFSSGSSGQPKGAVHDFARLVTKYQAERHRLRTLTFLLYDHIGGVDTLLYTLSNTGCVVTVDNRTPDAVLAAVARHRVQVLPVTPTFLNLILLSGAHRRHDLSSLTTIAYGTEPMPETTLRRVRAELPDVRLLQKYGLTEIGTLRSKSFSDSSVWMRIGGEGFETRVCNGMLQIKAHSAMMGYLNAPSPFTPDGWFITGDAVEQQGEYFRILGRQSDIINVGGQKVYPAEVENIIQEMDDVVAATVYREPHVITGNIVCARVTLRPESDGRISPRDVRSHCRQRLEPYKVPVKVQIVSETLHTARFKKDRPGIL